MTQRFEIPGAADRPRLLYLARRVAYPSSTSGAEARVAAFMHGLAEIGVPTLAFVGDPPAPTLNVRESAARRLLPPVVRAARRDVKALLGARRWVSGEIESIRAFRPTVVLERAEYLDSSGADIVRRLDIPHVLELHGLLADDVQKYYRSPLELVGRSRENGRYLRADRTIVVSSGLAHWLEERGVARERIAVIANGSSAIDDIGRVRSEAEAIRRSWDVGDRRVIGWIGHLMSWQVHAFRRLVDALNEVDRRIPVALVVIAPMSVGAKAVRDDVARRAAFPAIFPGERSGDAASAAVCAFDLGVIPAARPYDLPVKLFHYASLGVASVAPRTASISEFDDERLLYLFDADVPRALADTIEQALSDDRLRERGARLRVVVEARHTWRRIIEQTLQVVTAAGG